MTPEPTGWFSHPVVMQLVVTSVPIAAYLLWGDYFSRWIDQLAQANPAFERKDELRRVRAAGIWTMLFQFVLHFLLLGAVRYDQEGAPQALLRTGRATSFLFLFGGLLAQAQIQFKLEKKVRGLAATSADHASLTLRSLTVGFANLAVFLLCVNTITFLSIAWVAPLRGIPHSLKVILIVAGFVAGLAGGLIASLWASPLLFRGLMPTQKVEAPAVLDLIKECFESARLSPPITYLIHLDRLDVHNALLLGPKFRLLGSGPHLFVTQSILTRFNRDELKAVLLHEASHLALSHARTRVTRSAVFFGAALVIVMPVLLFLHATSARPAAALLGVAVPLLVYFAHVVSIRRLIAQQELEADAFAVLKLGASPEGLISALRALDEWNQVSSSKPDPSSLLSTTSAHPTTDLRVQRIQSLAKRPEAESPQRKAA